MYAYITRTLIPIVVGALISWAATVGLDLPATETAIVITSIVTFAYGVTARLVETRWPAIGRVLISLGLTKYVPVYLPHNDPTRSIYR